MSSRQAARLALTPVVLALLCLDVAVAQTVSQEKRTALEEVDALSSEIHLMAMTLWEYSETAMSTTSAIRRPSATWASDWASAGRLQPVTTARATATAVGNERCVLVIMNRAI